MMTVKRISCTYHAFAAALLYLNRLLSVSFALNMHDFAKKHRISSGPDWSVRVEKVSQ